MRPRTGLERGSLGGEFDTSNSDYWNYIPRQILYEGFERGVIVTKPRAIFSDTSSVRCFLTQRPTENTP